MPAPETEIVVPIDKREPLHRVFRPGEYVIGSAPEAEICVADELVSARHALLTLQEGHALIEDLGSASGTRVNGQPVRASTRLWPGQKIQLGGASIQFRRLKSTPQPGITLSPGATARPRLLPPGPLRARQKHDCSIRAPVRE